MPHLFQVAAKAVVVKNRKSLVLRGTIQNGPEKGVSVWDLPGGRLENNETLNQALLRELSEELPGASNIEIQQLLLADRGFHREDQQDLIILYFLVTAELPTVNLSPEHTDFIWVDRAKLSELRKLPAKDFFNSMLSAIDLALQ